MMTGPPWLEWMLRLYPRAYRDRFGDGMRAMLREHYHEAQQRGRVAVTLLWLRTLRDGFVIGLSERTAGWGTAGQWRDDVRHAVRVLRRAPAFTAAAVLTLSLAFALVAATTALVNAYLLRAMPYPDADRLYRVSYAPAGEPEPRGLSALDWTALAHVVENADNSAPTRLYTGNGGERQEIMGLMVARGSLDMLGVSAAAGRALHARDFASDAEAVMLIGHHVWRDRFSADRAVVGKILEVSRASGSGASERYRIIGVLPENFRYARAYDRGALDFVVPLREPLRTYLVQLRPGIRAPDAERVIDEAVRRTATSFPPGWRGVQLESVHHSYVAAVRPVLYAVTLASAIVLLITCINLTVLMLLRALRRQKEWAMRIALGAGRAQLVRMQIAESVVLCAAALSAGIALGLVALRTLEPSIEERLGRDAPGGTTAIAIDARVLVIVGLAGVVIALMLAAVPLLAPWQRRLADTLRSAGRGATDGIAARRARAALLSLQVAASLALLMGCTLMVRTVLSLVNTQLGYSTDNIVRARIALPPDRYMDSLSFMQFYDQLAERLAASATPHGLSTAIPFYEYPPDLFEVDGVGNIAAGTAAVSSSYFDVLDMRMLDGRGFTSRDRMGSEPVAIVSAAFAARLPSAGSVVGRRIRLADDASPWRSIIGVVNDVRQTHTDAQLADVYVPFAQAPARYAPIYARTELQPLAWLEQLRADVTAIDPLVVVTGDAVSSSLVALEDRLLAGPRFLMSLLTGFALFAALLTALGVYGVTAYSAQQRRRELAIRAAVGATRRQVVMLFVQDGARVAIAGVIAGLLGAALVARLLAHQLHGVQPFDPIALAIATAVIAAVALLASWWPAARASRHDRAMSVLNES